MRLQRRFMVHGVQMVFNVGLPQKKGKKGPVKFVVGILMLR
jgi:hypothetical protein